VIAGLPKGWPIDHRGEQDADGRYEQDQEAVGWTFPITLTRGTTARPGNIQVAAFLARTGDIQQPSTY